MFAFVGGGGGGGVWSWESEFVSPVCTLIVLCLSFDTDF